MTEQAGSKALARLFRDESLPASLADNADHQIPLASMGRLFSRSARAVGDPLFGLEIGNRMAPAEFGLWARYSAQGSTLGIALERIAKTLSLHQTGTTMRVAPRCGREAAWEYRHPGISSASFQHHSDHLVPVMVRFARAFLGDDWRPTRIEVGYSRPRHAGDLEAALGVPLRFDRPCLAMVFPAEALQARRPAPDAPERLLSALDVGMSKRLETATSRAEQIGAIMSLRLLDGLSDMEGTAQMLGVGRRTFQRHLADAGLSYRSLLLQLRMERARSLIEDTDAPLKRIGAELGYADAAHFTRAFARRFGVPPSAFRTTCPAA
ncbi:MAG: AraC family transcriptional regulator [Pseudomonadota bacterium]